jgi:hypothetical protein
MSINQRRHTRFSLDIAAELITKFGDRQVTLLQQISIGGCFTSWEENIYTGDEFRLEIELPNKNRLPLKCKAIYRFPDTGIGVKFIDISKFEQELICRIISERLRHEGIPVAVDPFEEPAEFLRRNDGRRSQPHATSAKLFFRKLCSAISRDLRKA